MITFKYPKRTIWESLALRPGIEYEEISTKVNEIMMDVKVRGDEALLDYNLQFDHVALADIKVDLTTKEFPIDADLAASIKLAKSNIERFHESQKEVVNKIETMKGVHCWRKSVPIERVGLYIPGGSAPLFSTLLMLAIPAKIAGCKNIVVCTPPQKDSSKTEGSGNLNEVIGWTCQLLGISNLYLTGGAQSIGAMTFGTQTIPRVDKLFGPGNQYVTAAKQKAQDYGVAIDMPAGPSEVLIIADRNANAAFVAADLLSQAEHGPDSQVILVSDSERLMGDVEKQIEKQLKDLPRKETALKTLENSKMILFHDILEGVEFSNFYSPEHLIIATDDSELLAEKITNAGSVFLGKWSCESAGDYASGTNHTLPTNGYARNYSGVSLDSFVKKITFQYLSEEGIKNIGPSIEKMAEAEQLQAHKNAVSLRLKALKNV